MKHIKQIVTVLCSLATIMIIILFGMKVISAIWCVLIPLFIGLITYLDLLSRYDKVSIMFKNDKTYFDDLAKRYDPSLLMMVYDVFSKHPLPLVTGLFQLERKGKIRIGEEIIIRDSMVDLQGSERYLLDCIRNKTLNRKASNKYKNLVIKEAATDDLIDNKPIIPIKHGLLISSIILIISIIVFAFILHNPRLIFTIIIAYLTFNAYEYIFASPTSLFSNSLTPRGREIASNLKGLRNYLKSFPKLEVHDQEDIVTWENYLIYSIIFGLNDKVNQQLSKFFITYKEKE